MRQNVLIPESFLAENEDKIRELVQVPGKGYAIDMEDENYGAAFRCFLLFAHRPDYLAGLYPGIDRTTIFYNQYCWFVRFSRLYMRKHGFDVGLEQQAFQMVENADCEIDLEIIDSLSETPHQIQA